MREWLVIMVVASMLAACSSAEPATTTTDPQPTSTTSAEPPEPSDTVEGWDPDVAARLVELEDGTSGDWTIDGAVEAFSLLRPVLVEGVDEYSPIDVGRLMWFLGENFDALTSDQLAILTGPLDDQPTALGGVVEAGFGAPPAPVLASRGPGIAEAEREAFQLAAVTASNDFATRTGHTLPSEIVVAYSQHGLLPGGLSAGTRTPIDPDWDLYRGFFATDAEYEWMRELFDAATADGGMGCLIIIGERFRNRAPAPRSAAIYHEVVHCHQQAIHPGGPAGFHSDPAKWMDEGYASWAGEFLVGGTTTSKSFWDYYHSGIGPIGGHITTEGGYDGIALFSYLHDNGADGWGNFVSWFGDVRGPGRSDAARFESLFGPLSDEAKAVWAATSLQRPDYSETWTYTTGPGIGNSTIKRTPRPTPVAEGFDTRYALAPGEQGTFAFEPRMGGADALLLEVALTGGGVIRWPWGEDQISTGPLEATWCLGDDCICDDGRVLGPPAPEFTESGVVTIALTGSVVAVRLVAPDDACAEPVAPALAATGPCPGGIWQADPEATEAVLLTLYRAFGIADPTYEGGPVSMSFFDDGTFRFDYEETTFTETIEGIDTIFVLNGGSEGTWEADATTLTVQIDGQDIVLDLYLEGTLAVTNSPPGGTGGGMAPYVCEGNDTLLIDPAFEQPLWPYPRVWTRTG